MKSEHKLYVAVAVVVVLGIGVYVSQKEDREVERSHSPAAAPSLPKVALSADQLKKVTKVEIKNKEKGDVILVKTGEAPKEKEPTDDADAGLSLDTKKDEFKYGLWKLAKPLAAPVNQSNVNTMLDNLEKVELTEVITKTTEQYKTYELEGDEAVHVVAYQDKDKVFDLWFGKSGSRGQMARVTGTDGVFVAKGYSSYLFTREVKHWRNTDIWKFEDANVIQVEIDNTEGKYSFTKGEKEWAATFAKREDGKLAAKAEPLEKFDEKKLESMLRAYKTLRATDFAEEGAETGLDDPAKNGGTLLIKLKDDAGEFKLAVGKKAKNDDRYAEQQGGGDGTKYVLSSWTAKWVVAEPKEFQKTEAEKDKDKDDDALDDDALDDGALDDDADEAGDKGKDKGKDAAKPAGTSKPKAPPASTPKAPKAPPPAKPKGGGEDPYQ